MISATVKLWGTQIGAVVQDNFGKIRFNYTDEFINMGINVSPLMMPLNRTVYEFPTLYSSGTFRGLPGLLADSMPDKFGNTIIKKYLTDQNILDENFGAVERLLYTGQRGMGALEYEPVSEMTLEYKESVDLQKLVKCATDVLTSKENLHFKSDENEISQILAVGTSAGGVGSKMPYKN